MTKLPLGLYKYLRQILSNADLAFTMYTSTTYINGSVNLDRTFALDSLSTTRDSSDMVPLKK